MIDVDTIERERAAAGPIEPTHHQRDALDYLEGLYGPVSVERPPEATTRRLPGAIWAAVDAGRLTIRHLIDQRGVRRREERYERPPRPV